MQRSPLKLIVISIIMCALGIRIVLASQSVALKVFAGVLALIWAVAVVRQIRAARGTQTNVESTRQE
jgi:hypothetical protein